MTVDELIAEGRRLQRPTILLTPEGAGDPAAVWYGHDYAEDPPEGHRCWISVRAGSIPSFDGQGWLSVFTNDESCEGGSVKISSAPHRPNGLLLYPKEIAVLPPIDAVFTFGSPSVERWLVDNKWQRDWPYNSNFRDHAVVDKFEAVRQLENPLYWKDAYASLGGWHVGWPDDDWHDLLDAKLLVHTYMDSEPWLEAWQFASGEMRVIQRIT
jgi:hypothetical protein